MSMTADARLTRRHQLAVIVIAGVLLLNYLLFARQLSLTEADGHLINISGQQRMLSQRIALLVHQIADSDAAHESDSTASSLNASLQQMMHNHNELEAIWRSRARDESGIYRRYLENGNLADKVHRFLAQATAFHQHLGSGAVDPVHREELARRLDTYANGTFLDELNHVVATFQRDYERKIFGIKRVNKLLILVGLLVLLLDYRFIFRPMMERIVSAIRTLTQRNNDLTALSSRISHTIRAPVSSSLGLIELVHDSVTEGDKEDALEVIDLARLSLKRLDILIGELLQVLHSQGVKEVPTRIDVSSLLDQTIRRLSVMEGFDRVEIRTSFCLDVPVCSSPAALRLIVQNLISNAVRFADHRKSVSTVDVAVSSTHNGDVVIEVSDNGVGIPACSRSEIFGMFKRFHPALSSGSGLGLYLVSRSARDMGGDSRYLPLPDGSKFTITIPNHSEGELSSTLQPSYS